MAAPYTQRVPQRGARATKKAAAPGLDAAA
jgi:hypothetical protein